MNATTVARIGLSHAMCSFHSIPKVCQSFVAGLASRIDLGLDLSVARYQGYTTQVPVSTVPHAATAIATTPILSRRIRSTTPCGVTRPARRLYSPARPPAKASRNTAPKPIPWMSPHHSLSVKCIGTSSVRERFPTVSADREPDDRVLRTLAFH